MSKDAELQAANGIVSANIGIEVHDDKKEHVQHVEDAEMGSKAVEREVDYDAQETQNRSGLRRMLRRNPSYEFIREVAIKDTEELEQPQVKKLERRIFWMIVPALCIDYIFYYIDKDTLGYAALFGMRKDLNLVGTNYSTLGSVFYLGWLAWQLPGNLLMAKFPMSKYLGVNIFLWGVFLMAQGGSKNFETMVALRFISGAFEAVAKPGFMAITGAWFTRVQQPLVISCWYASQGVGIAFGGLIGFGIGQIPAKEVWRYEFLIIGAACAAWGITMSLIIPDSPYENKRFTREEKIVIMSRKRDDYHNVEKRQIKWSQVWECAKDVKMWLYFFLGLTANIPNGGTSNFGTLMVNGFGFSTLGTTLLQIPYGLSQTFFIVTAMYIGHKTHHLNIRTYLMAAVLLIVVAGFVMMAYGQNQATKLIGYYFTGASNAVFAFSLALVNSNTGGNTKKLMASAITFVGVGLGNVIGPYAFLDSEKPTYRTGITVCMASRIAEIIVILLLRLTFVLPNRNRDKKFANGDAAYDPNVVTYEDKTDLENLHFRYLA